MRILITINTFRGSKSNGNIVFAEAWRRFFERHRRELGIDVLFVNNGFDRTLFDNKVSPYEVFHIEDLKLPKDMVPFDTDATFHSLDRYSSKYDFVIRADHDAFPSYESLEAIIDFLGKNPDVDLLSASNYPRCIEHERSQIKELDTRFVPTDKIKEWKWWPWGVPTQNGDMIVIRSEFFRRCLNIYNNHPKLGRCRDKKICPMSTSRLNYGEVLSMLGASDDNVNSKRSTKLHIDGAINLDFWTIMCSIPMKMAGIVDQKGRSFARRNHMVPYAEAMTATSYDQAEDPIDISFPHKLNVSAPYFHVGNGYIAEWYFDGSEDDSRPQPFMIPMKSSATHFHAAHYRIVWELTKASGDSALLKELESRMDRIMDRCGTDKKVFREFGDRVSAFYRPAMKDHM